MTTANEAQYADDMAESQRVRYAMNSALILLGSHVAALADECVAAARRIGAAEADMGATACKVPGVAESIEKVRSRGSLCKKRKSAKC